MTITLRSTPNNIPPEFLEGLYVALVMNEDGEILHNLEIRPVVGEWAWVESVSKEMREHSRTEEGHVVFIGSIELTHIADVPKVEIRPITSLTL